MHIQTEWTDNSILSYIFTNAYYFLMYAAPVIFLAGMTITTSMLCRGMKRGGSLKEECLLLGAFALTAPFYAYMLGQSMRCLFVCTLIKFLEVRI